MRFGRWHIVGLGNMSGHSGVDSKLFGGEDIKELRAEGY